VQKEQGKNTKQRYRKMVQNAYYCTKRATCVAMHHQQFSLLHMGLFMPPLSVGNIGVA